MFLLESGCIIRNIFAYRGVKSMIREAGKKDLDRIIELYKFLNPDDNYSDNSKFEEVWNEIIKLNKYFKCFVLEVNNLIVSTCILNIIPNLTRSCSPYGVIENVITDPEFQGNGFGKKIMKHAVEHSKESGCYKVMLLSSAKREGAHKFYKSLGFDSSSKKGFQIRF